MCVRFITLLVLTMCDPMESSLKLLVISARDRLFQSIIRSIFLVDRRDMLSDSLTNGIVDRTLLEQFAEHHQL